MGSARAAAPSARKTTAVLMVHVDCRPFLLVFPRCLLSASAALRLSGSPLTHDRLISTKEGGAFTMVISSSLSTYAWLAASTDCVCAREFLLPLSFPRNLMAELSLYKVETPRDRTRKERKEGEWEMMVE